MIFDQQEMLNEFITFQREKNIEDEPGTSQVNGHLPEVRTLMIENKFNVLDLNTTCQIDLDKERNQFNVENLNTICQIDLDKERNQFNVGNLNIICQINLDQERNQFNVLYLNRTCQVVTHHQGNQFTTWNHNLMFLVEIDKWKTLDNIETFQSREEYPISFHTSRAKMELKILTNF
jgi:hypothetical protein